MSNELRVYRFAPDQPGRGGHTTGMNAFLGIEDIRYIDGLRPSALMWQRDQSAVELSYQYTGDSKVVGFLEWWQNKDNLGAQAFRLIALRAKMSGQFANYVNVLGGKTQYNVVQTAAFPGETPITMLPVKDRLFMCTGDSTIAGSPYTLSIWDGTTSGNSPASGSVYAVGVPSPTVAPTLTISYNTQIVDMFYKYTQSLFACNPVAVPGALWRGIVPGETVWLYDTVNATSVPVVVKAISMGYTDGSAPNSGAFPLGVPTSSVVTVDGTSGDTWVDFNAVLGTNVDGAAVQLIGLAFVFGGNDFTIIGSEFLPDGFNPIATRLHLSAALPWNITGSSSWMLRGVQLELTERTDVYNLSPTNYTALVRVSAAGTGYATWTGAEAPGYAYAYYDSATGHISNLSPITYLSNTDVVNGRVTIDIRRNSGVACANGDAGSGSSSATGIQYVGDYFSRDAVRFNKILWFRTRRVGGGAMLYPLGSLDPSSGAWRGISGLTNAMSSSPWIDTTTDAELLLSGRIRPPLTTNNQPRIVNAKGVATRIVPWGMAWWDGRVWAYGPPDMGALHFSCDDAQSCMGRPEECWPDSNRLTIPAGDVEITSILTVGQYLVVNTRKYTWVVMGNHETNYRLVRVSTELGGAKITNCCEIPMSGEGQGMMAVVTNDQRVLLVSIGGQLEEIGRPIRDVLGGPCRGVQFYRAGGHPRLMISMGTVGDWSAVPGAVSGTVYEYNFDHKIWTQNPPDLTSGVGNVNGTIEALGVVQRAGPWTWPSLGQNESFPVYGFNGAIWGDTVDAITCHKTWTLQTWDLPKDAPKRRYSLAWVRALVARAVPSGIGGIGLPVATVTVDDVASPTKTFSGTLHEHADPARRAYPTEAGLGLDTREFIVYGPELAQNGVVGKLPLGYKIRVTLSPTTGVDSLRYSIPYFEVALREETEDGTIDP